mmetsp:Transcript_8348/g.11485  ORF Transcript_8348/g.11485 Transcript_8348/m.11485 type:complete len:84 (+) Transcript_8348:163-414(+)
MRLSFILLFAHLVLNITADETPMHGNLRALTADLPSNNVTKVKCMGDEDCAGDTRCDFETCNSCCAPDAEMCIMSCCGVCEEI